MRKQITAVVTLALVWSSVVLGQTREEEIRQEKLMLQQLQTVQHSRISPDEEMRQVKREYRTFMAARRYANKPVTEAEEMKQVKQGYRAYLTDQRRQRMVAAGSTR